MKKLLVCLVTLVSLQSFAQETVADVKIMQNGKVVKHNLGVFKLARAPFQFNVQLAGVEGFYVSADLSSTTYNIPFGQPLPNYAGNVLAESPNNVKRQLNISSSKWSYWSNASRSFDEPVKADAHGIYSYKKTVTQLYNPATKTAISLAQAAPVYLYLVAKNPGGNGEYVRLRYKIEWL